PRPGRGDRHIIHRPGRGRAGPVLAEHQRRQPDHRADRHPRGPGARVRVGRGYRQRVPPGRRVSTLEHDPERPPQDPGRGQHHNAHHNIKDEGITTAAAVAAHSLTMYRSSSGGLVFGAGTVQWAWGLDGIHDGPTTVTDPAMRQATINLLADMGVQPETLQPGLRIATASTDAIAPTSIITSPSAGANLTTGTAVTITGTAADAGGGVVMAVEVSTDGGQTWHRATGRNNWTYTWTPMSGGPVTIRSRAVDDSANLEAPGAGVTVPVKLAATSTTGLVGAWSFNAGSGPTVTDSSGNGNNGTISGATWTTSGKYGSALLFNGVSDWVTVNDANTLDLTNALTMEAWVKPSSLSNFTNVIMKERTGGLSYALYSSDGANNPPAAYISSGTDRSGRATSVLPLSTWSHLA